jgi:hypothetical protein
MFGAHAANDGRAGRKRQENLGNPSEALFVFPATYFSGNREDELLRDHSFDVNKRARVDSQGGRAEEKPLAITSASGFPVNCWD